MHVLIHVTSQDIQDALECVNTGGPRDYVGCPVARATTRIFSEMDWGSLHFTKTIVGISSINLLYREHKNSEGIVSPRVKLVAAACRFIRTFESCMFSSFRKNNLLQPFSFQLDVSRFVDTKLFTLPEEGIRDAVTRNGDSKGH